MRTKILYEDKDIIVAGKPAGLATQTARAGQVDMVSELKNHLAASGKGVPYLGVVHRLDQPVEGLLVFGKTKEATAKLTAQLGEGTLNKEYYAVVCGQPSEKSQKLVDDLVKDKNNLAVVVTGQAEQYPEAKKAVLEYQVLKQISQPGDLCKVEVHIETGRFHQIRVQMAHAGLPLLGDSKYGNPRSVQLSNQLGIRQVALCARSVSFRHPRTGQELSFTIELQNPAFAILEKE